MATPATAPSISRPLFGGYALVAVTVAWIAGIALRSVGPLPLVLPWVWLIAGVPALIFLFVLVQRRSLPEGAGGRFALILAILLLALAFGAARAAWADPPPILTLSAISR